jgi:pimeloyl-ACP methyl ester carboxylesterase
MILETPFISIEEMLVALYPQKWLPYRYLKPFLWNHWDLVGALARIELRRDVRVLIMKAERDELVPDDHAKRISSMVKGKGGVVRDVVVKGALHVECVFKDEGKREVVGFLKGLGDIRSKDMR